MSAITNERVLVKCGGFSSQLAKNVEEQVDGDPLWGSRFDWTNPAAVVQTHLDFLRNGADIILSNTYQSSVEGFMKYLELSREDSIALIAKSVQLAKEAKSLHLQEVKSAHGHIVPGLPLILASIGPFGAHLHDGSEYDGSYTDRVTKAELQQWHRTRIETCLKEGVDGLAVETIPCQLEAEALTELILKEYADVKFWVSFQCQDEQHLAHGENFATAALSIWQLVKEHKATARLLGLGMNCLKPKYVSPLLKSFIDAAEDEKQQQIPLLVYSNRGETFNSDRGMWTGTEECTPLESFVPEWLSLGVRIVGGCCRVYPNDILQVRKCIDNIGNNN